MSFTNFTELEVYKECRLFRKDVSVIVKTFPKEEKFLLSSQLLDAARSITANIAEGFGRFHFQENIQFCRISRGSLTESLEHLITAFDENYISTEKLVEMKAKFDKCLKLLNGYIHYLEKSKRGDK
jgi:four helix bundle protein